MRDETKRSLIASLGFGAGAVWGCIVVGHPLEGAYLGLLGTALFFSGRKFAGIVHYLRKKVGKHER